MHIVNLWSCKTLSSLLAVTFSTMINISVGIFITMPSLLVQFVTLEDIRSKSPFANHHSFQYFVNVSSFWPETNVILTNREGIYMGMQ